MTLSIHDVLMLSLQFFYAFGGMILIGSLIFNILKNQALVNEKRLGFEQEFEVELSARLVEQQPRASLNIGNSGVTREIARHGGVPISKDGTPGGLHEPDTSRDGMPLKKQRFSVQKRVAGQGKKRLYKTAASLAARGFNAEDIRHRVGLPQCEIDLIASINDTHAKGRWERHQSMMDAIDAGN